MMSEKEKMLAGQEYCCLDRELCQDRIVAKQICQTFNNSDPGQWEDSVKLLKSLFDQTKSFLIEPGFQCTYGYNIQLGENFYANFGFTVIDANKVVIGSNVMLGPGVHIYTAIHPTNVSKRNSGIETSAPAVIGDHVWIGGKALICPGVTIGSNTTIGAGSVVINDIPDNVVAVGNPCRVKKIL